MNEQDMALFRKMVGEIKHELGQVRDLILLRDKLVEGRVEALERELKGRNEDPTPFQELEHKIDKLNEDVCAFAFKLGTVAAEQYITTQRLDSLETDTNNQQGEINTLQDEVRALGDR